jgi:hypothetical protein
MTMYGDDLHFRPFRDRVDRLLRAAQQIASRTIVLVGAKKRRALTEQTRKTITRGGDLALFLLDDAHDLFNEAEFVVTFAQEEETNDVLEKCFERLVDARDLLVKYLEGTTRTGVRAYVLDADLEAREMKDFPYDSILVPKAGSEEFLFLARSRAPKDFGQWPFHVQCTVGVPLGHAREVMRLFLARGAGIQWSRQAQYGTIPEMIDIFRRVDDELRPDGTTTMEVLFLFYYHLETANSRKNSPFVIRHRFSELLSLIPTAQRKTVQRLWPEIQRARHANLADDKSMMGVTTIPLDTSDTADDTMIYIEIRFFSEIVLHELLGGRSRQQPYLMAAPQGKTDAQWSRRVRLGDLDRLRSSDG